MRTILAILILGALCGVTVGASAGEEAPAASGPTALTGSPASLAMDLSAGRPMVRLTVDGHGPYDFIVDTGAGTSVIDEGLAKELGLEEVGHQTLRSPGSGGGVEGRRVRADRIAAGALRIERPVLVTMDLATLSAGTIDGVLGREPFAHLLLTLDLPASRLIVEKGSLDPVDPGVIRMDPAVDGVRVAIDLAGRSFPMDVDSGSPGGFTLPKRLEPDLSWRSPPAPGPTIHLVGGIYASWLAELDGTLHLGGLSFPNPRIVLTTFADDFGNIGFQVLRGLRVTLDQEHGLIAFARPATAEAGGAEPRAEGGTARNTGGPPRLGVRFAMTPDGFAEERGGLVVQGVDADGAAAAAGLRAGDVLVRVGGKPVAGVSGAELAALLRAPRPLELEVLRGDRRLEIVVP